ncbi:hypothetical protein, partial [Siminovitchia terrae]
ASVRPEPGSNSHKKNLLAHNKADFKIIIDVSFRSVFKDQTCFCFSLLSRATFISYQTIFQASTTFLKNFFSVTTCLDSD